VPSVGGLSPDKTQRTRVRLKVALIDAKFEQWELFVPESFEDIDASGRLTRVSSDQVQVAMLKDRGYRVAVEELLKRYVC